MSRFFTQGVALLVLVTLIANSNGQQWYDCGTTLSQRLVRFNTFAAFPSPAIPGQQVHLRATYQAYAQLNSTATVQMSVMYGSESVLAVSGIPLCNLTSSVSCPVVATPNYTQAISFDWTVPSVADGNYLVNFKIVSPGKASAFGCITFNISVSNPSATQNGVFVSSYQAQLEGAAQFTTSPYSSREVGSSIQVGPIGPLGASLPWGTFGYVYGTGDVVHPSFDPTNYIWGMSGTLINKSIDPVQSSNFYEGQFWIGYSGPYGNYNTQNNTLTSGTFTLYHSQISSSNYTFNGLFTFLPYGGVFPTGWFNPINLARLGPAVLSTDQYGHLIVGASTGTCLASPTLTTCPGVNNQVSPGPARDNDPHLVIKIVLPIVFGILFLILLVLAALRYRRKQKKASEDRVYNPRPAEYGSALVVDDIMQKSRNHTGAALPILDPSSRQSFPPVYLDEMPAPVVANPRTVRRTPQEPRIDDRRRRSTRQDRRPAPRRPAYSDSDSEPQLRGRGGNRSRSPESRGRDLSRSRSRSRSVSRSRSISRSRSLSRSRSPSRSDRGSRSRSVSRSRSPSGSSVSRSSYSEGPRR